MGLKRKEKGIEKEEEEGVNEDRREKDPVEERLEEMLTGLDVRLAIDSFDLSAIVPRKRAFWMEGRIGPLRGRNRRSLRSLRRESRRERGGESFVLRRSGRKRGRRTKKRSQEALRRSLVTGLRDRVEFRANGMRKRRESMRCSNDLEGIDTMRDIVRIDNTEPLEDKSLGNTGVRERKKRRGMRRSLIERKGHETDKKSSIYFKVVVDKEAIGVVSKEVLESKASLSLSGLSNLRTVNTTEASHVLTVC